LKPGPARRVDPGPEPGRVDEKTGEGKTRCDPAGRPGDPADLARPGQDPVTNPLAFVFFVFFLLKRRRFDFFLKELTRTTRSNPVTRPKPGTQALDLAGS
jgi:hypothetical protein